MARILGFPNPVNETAARVVAGGVVALAVSFLVSGSGWVLAVILYGFLARVLTGPVLSPLGRLAVSVVSPALERRGHRSRLVPGPPKRFAQAVGLAFSLSASLLWLVGAYGAAQIVVVALIGAAFLEAAFGLCLGCVMFGWLMKAGLIPESVCVECNDISARLAAQNASRNEGTIAVGD